MWRALRVIRERRRGALSVVIHSRLVQYGVLTTMSIVVQRFYLMLVYGVRMGFQVIPWLLPDWRDTIEPWIPGHDLCVTFSVVFPSSPFFYPVFGDLITQGLRSPTFHQVFGPWLFTSLEEKEEVFGTLEAPAWERYLWLIRFPTYIAMRAAVTKGFTELPPRF